MKAQKLIVVFFLFLSPVLSIVQAGEKKEDSGAESFLKKHSLYTKFVGLRTFINTGNQDKSINRSTGNTYKLQLFPTDESFAFETRFAFAPVVDTEYLIEQNPLGDLWGKIYMGFGGAYSGEGIYLALIYNYGYASNEDLYNISIDDSPEYNNPFEGKGPKLVVQGDAFALMVNQRKYRGTTDRKLLDLTAHHAFFSLEIYERGDSLHFESSLRRLYHKTYGKNTAEAGLVWRTDNPGWISLFSGIELGVAALFDFDKKGNEAVNWAVDIAFGNF
ncbi:MAG: hypothetical protein GY866_16625 [Proteobacteria bacterium]|nr:hypothetical protein [Pseudomonadota bacterium]